MDKEEAEVRFKKGYEYYLIIRTGIHFGDTREIFAQQFTSLLTTMKSHFEPSLRNEIYQIADQITKVDGEVDKMEQAFLSTISELWDIGVDEGKEYTSRMDPKDIKSELEKYKQMLDEGLIDEEQYNTKSNELLKI